MTKSNPGKVDKRIGNQFWRARSSHGANPKFSGPEKLWDACCEYFDWVEANPLKEEKGFAFQGVVTKEKFSKMRAMTTQGLCLFLDIQHLTWRLWRADRKDLLTVITRAEQVIYQQKFSGAAAELLNPNIIARDLGLADRSEVTGKDGGPIEVIRSVKDISGAIEGKLAGIAGRADPPEVPSLTDD